MKKFSAAFIAASITALGLPALAQQSTPPTPTGPVIPGLCVVSSNALIGTSQLGQFIQTRMAQISNQTSAELNQTQQGLETDRSNLRAQVEAQGEAALASQIQAYDQRVQQFIALNQQRGAEIERTAELAEQRFATEVEPVIIEVSQARRCSIVLAAEATLIPDPRSDITADIVTALNAKITSFPIEKVQLQLQPQQ